MTPEHLPLLVALDSDAEVLRHILGRARTAREATDFWGPKCADTVANAQGLGWWVGFLSTDAADGSDFVGWWDLSPGSIDAPATAAKGRAEAGWRLTRRHWRKGLASEGAAALLAHGFGSVGLEVVWAETMAVNVGSRGVMRRLGMTHVRTEHRDFDHPLPGSDQGEVVYEITRGQWFAARDDQS